MRYRLTENKLRGIIQNSVYNVLREMNEGSAFSHSNNEWGNDYFTEAQLLANGISDTLRAMEENADDIDSMRYLYNELERKIVELNNKYKLIRKYIK